MRADASPAPALRVGFPSLLCLSLLSVKWGHVADSVLQGEGPGQGCVCVCVCVYLCGGWGWAAHRVTHPPLSPLVC